MFKNSYQSGLLSIFYSCGSQPLALWEMEVNNGHIKRLTDSEVNSIVLEIVSTNVATTYITCPPNNQYLGIKLPFLVMIVKNLKRYFSFEITVLDDKNMRRRFRISNFQSTTKIKPFCTTMPIGLSGGWNQIQFNLSDFTRRAYGTQFVETLRVQVHANVRLRRIYFAERLFTEEELPQDYKLYLPLEKKGKRGAKKEEVKAPEAASEPSPPVPPAVAPPPEQLAPEAKKSFATPKQSLTAQRSIATVKSSTAPTPEKKPSKAGQEVSAEESALSEGPPQTPTEEGEAAVEGESPRAEAEPEGQVESEALAETTAIELAEAPAEASAEATAEATEEATAAGAE